MGDVRVPKDAKWRAQTQRAVENFPVSGLRIESGLIAALAAIKGTSAEVRGELGLLDGAKAKAIADAAGEIADGRWDDEFPVDVYQTGSGTSSNMNANEVIATLAAERLGAPVHPNDDVNDPFSSNDVFPSAIHIAAVRSIVRDLIPALDHLAAALERKRDAFADVVKSGRTHLMDATPVTLGQEFGGYAAAVRYGIDRLEDVLPRAGELPSAARRSAPASTHRPVWAARSSSAWRARSTCRSPRRATTSRRRARATRSSRRVACCASSPSAFTRWPTTSGGCRPARAPGSPRSTCPTCSRGPRSCRARSTRSSRRPSARSSPRSSATTRRWPSVGRPATSSSTSCCPSSARNLLESIRLLSNISRLFADRCIDGIEADVERCRTYAESSPSIVTPLNHYIGYDEAALVAKQALKEAQDHQAGRHRARVRRPGQDHRRRARPCSRRAVDDSSINGVRGAHG